MGLMMVKGTMNRFMKSHLPTILYVALIIFLSSIPSDKQPELDILKFDKVIHLVEYGIFAWLVYRSTLQLLSDSRKKLTAILSFLFIVGVAFFDETFQGYIPGRTNDIFDSMADILGGAIIIVFLHYYKGRHEKS